MRVARTFVLDASRRVVAVTNGDDEAAKAWGENLRSHFAASQPITPEYAWMALPFSVVSAEVESLPHNETWIGRQLTAF